MTAVSLLGKGHREQALLSRSVIGAEKMDAFLAQAAAASYETGSIVNQLAGEDPYGVRQTRKALEDKGMDIGLRFIGGPDKDHPLTKSFLDFYERDTGEASLDCACA